LDYIIFVQAHNRWPCQTITRSIRDDKKLRFLIC
jgi:hypothetical protein